MKNWTICPEFCRHKPEVGRSSHKKTAAWSTIILAHHETTNTPTYYLCSSPSQIMAFRSLLDPLQHHHSFIGWLYTVDTFLWGLNLRLESSSARNRISTQLSWQRRLFCYRTGLQESLGRAVLSYEADSENPGSSRKGNGQEPSDKTTRISIQLLDAVVFKGNTHCLSTLYLIDVQRKIREWFVFPPMFSNFPMNFSVARLFQKSNFLLWYWITWIVIEKNSPENESLH